MKETSHYKNLSITCQILEAKKKIPDVSILVGASSPPVYTFERVKACEARLEELVKWAEDGNKFIMGKYGAVCGKVGRKEEESFWSSMRKMSRGVLAELQEKKSSVSQI